MNVLQKPFDNVHVRRAIAYALNRTALINAWGGYAAPVYQFLTAGLLQNIGTAAQVSESLKSVPTYPFNLAKAKAEMAKSPYAHGVDATISVEGAGSYPNVSQAIQAELARIGIHLTLKVTDRRCADGQPDFGQPQGHPDELHLQRLGIP